MHRHCGFGARRLGEAEDLAGGLVEPIVQIRDTVGALDLQVRPMRPCDIAGGGSVWQASCTSMNSGIGPAPFSRMDTGDRH